MFQKISQSSTRVFILFSLVLMLGLSSCGGQQTRAPSHQLLNTNLIINGDAEMGQGSPDDSSLVTIPGWTRIENSNVLQYSNTTKVDGISFNDSGPAHRGNNYFYGGPGNNSLAGLEQIIDVSVLSDQVDNSNIHFTLSAYLGGYANRADYALLNMVFLDTKGHALKGVEVGPVRATDRQDKTGIFLRSLDGTVPVSTRKIDITLNMIKATNLEGPGNTACADNLSAIFHL